MAPKMHSLLLLITWAPSRKPKGHSSHHQPPGCSTQYQQSWVSPAVTTTSTSSCNVQTSIPQSLQEKPLPRRIQRVSRLRPVFTSASSLRRVILGLGILPLLRLNNSNCKLWGAGPGDFTPSDNLRAVLLNKRGVASGWCQLASAISPLRSTAKTRCVSIARSMIARLKGRLLQSMSSIMSIRLIIQYIDAPG
jgi:hypothetical protein